MATNGWQLGRHEELELPVSDSASWNHLLGDVTPTSSRSVFVLRAFGRDADERVVLMNDARFRISELGLSEHVRRWNAAQSSIVSRAVELGTAVGIENFSLAFSEIGRFSESIVQQLILLLLNAFDNIAAKIENSIRSAIVNHLGQLVVVVGELNIAAELFIRALELVTPKVDKKTLLQNPPSLCNRQPSFAIFSCADCGCSAEIRLAVNCKT